MLCLQAYDAFFSLVCTHCKLLIGYYLLSFYYLLHSGRLPTPLSITLELFSSSGSILSFLVIHYRTSSYFLSFPIVFFVSVVPNWCANFRAILLSIFGRLCLRYFLSQDKADIWLCNHMSSMVSIYMFSGLAITIGTLSHIYILKAIFLVARTNITRIILNSFLCPLNCNFCTNSGLDSLFFFPFAQIVPINP